MSLLTCRVGDAVFGQVMGGMASHVVADARTLVTQPPNLTAVEASTIPTTFLTAYECLMAVAGIQHNTRVLVHAATGPDLLHFIPLHLFLPCGHHFLRQTIPQPLARVLLGQEMLIIRMC